jgi:hypothetical protein|tara:strand:+ start:1014 stop:1226 length:213 start_codon:yes stop_codon:yes gene_type:complete
MNKKRLLTHKERAFIIQEISGVQTFNKQYKKMTKEEKDFLIDTIICKIMCSQDTEDYIPAKKRKILIKNV